MVAGKNIFGIGGDVAAEHYKAIAATKDVKILLAAPVLLRDALIIIDDIERTRRSGHRRSTGFCR